MFRARHRALQCLQVRKTWVEARRRFARVAVGPTSCRQLVLAPPPHRALKIGAIYSGHDHNNDYLGVLRGVRSAWPCSVALFRLHPSGFAGLGAGAGRHSAGTLHPDAW